MSAPLQVGNANAGYLTQGDIVTKTADGIDLNDLWREFINATTVFNQHKSDIVSMLTYQVTSNIELVPMVGELRFEEASEFGIPRGGKTNISYYQLAYDFHDWDLKIAYTWKFLRDSSSEQVAVIHTKAFDADRELLFTKTMEAIFDNRSRSAEINMNTYGVYPLANGDAWIPPKYKGKTFTTHNHYLVSGAATLDSEDFEDSVRHLTEHGYGRDTGTTIVCLANSAQIASILLWKKGVVSANGKTALYDFVPSAAQPPMFIPSGEGLLGSTPPNRWNGLVVEGSYMNVLIIEEPLMPEGYLLFLASGGGNSAENLVGIRIHPSAEWQGLRLIPGNQARYPLLDAYYMHGFGTGIRNRTGAVVLQVKASGNYDIPAAFSWSAGHTTTGL